jgi:uncharacterized Zn finger protein (UPF0148 family)
MLIIICPTCGSDLVEEGRNGRIDCLKCADDFELGDAKYKYIKLSEVKPVDKIDAPKPKKAKLKQKDNSKYSEFLQYYKNLRGNENE